MNSQELRALQEAYSQVYELDENRMVSRMEKMPTPPAKVGKGTHSIKDLPRLKEPSSKEKAKARKALGLGEAVDLYDIILSHLLDEGYADTEQAAEAIMVNMSEEWRETIVVEGYKEIEREKHGRMYDRYKKLGTAAMKDARETGEASGDNRFKMSKMMGVIDKSAENLRNKR